MAMQTMNGAQEIEMLVNPPETPDLKRDATGKFLPAETKPAKVVKEDDSEETPEWVTRGRFSQEQHGIVTDVVKRLINKKHAQAKDAEEFAVEQYSEKRVAEQRLQQLESEISALRANATPAKTVEEAKKPVRNTFENDEDYIEAVADWKTEQKFKEREDKAIADREAERIQAITNAAHARIAAARTFVPDFDEVVNAADVNVPGHIAMYMQESDLFAELGYHFAQHGDDLKKISNMPSRTVTDLQRIGVALAKIEGTLKPFGKTTPVVKSKTNGYTPNDDDDDDDGATPSNTGTLPSLKTRASAPIIQPLSSGSDTQVQKRESSMSYDEARANWEKRNRRAFDHRKRH